MISARCALLLMASVLGSGALAFGEAHPGAGSGWAAQAVTFPDAQLEPIAWPDLAGWADDDHAAAFAVFHASCHAIAAARKSMRDARPMARALAGVCRDAQAFGHAGPGRAREFFEKGFRALRIARLGESAGFVTGYYEPVVEGSLTWSPEFTVPIYRRPGDIVFAGRHRPGGSRTISNKAKAWRRVDGKRLPYYDRGEIEGGALAGRGLEICWLKDPADAFFIHIQGSARVRLADGGVLRLNYDGHNGQPYTPVGAILIQEGQVERSDMSMDRIRRWMRDNPDRAAELRQKNRSFVFFRVAELADDQEAIGGQGIPLAAGRSLAVDRKLHAYGTPFWVDAELPLAHEGSSDAFRRLMIAQDTGSAIVGPARADLYLGAGVEAGRVAGRIKHPARIVILVPRGLDPGSQGPVPFPPVRPKE